MTGGLLCGTVLSWKPWDWGDPTYRLTGDANIGWVRSGTLTTTDGGQQPLAVGDAVAGFARGALERGTTGDHPDIAYSW
jgi:hypothetical protein